MTCLSCPSAPVARQKFHGIPRVINQTGLIRPLRFGSPDQGSLIGRSSVAPDCWQREVAQAFRPLNAVESMHDSRISPAEIRAICVKLKATRPPRREETEMLEIITANILSFQGLHFGR